MRKLGLMCVVVLVCMPSVPLAPAGEGGALLDAAHWTAPGTSELLGEVAREVEGLDAGDSRTLARAGHILLRAGRTDQAADVFQRAQKADPKDDEAFILIAMAFRERKMWAEADEWFARAVERDPKDLDHLLEWGVSYWNRGDREKAAQMFVKVLRSEPKNARYYYNIGRGIE